MIVHQPASGPYWRNVMGARVQFAPIDRPLVRRARRAAMKTLGRDEHGPEPDGEAADIELQLEDLGDALSEAMILEGVLGWEGPVIRRDDGEEEPLPFSREALQMALSDPMHFDAFDLAYVVPYATRERAKNGFAASPSGIGEAATQDSDTASTAATPSAQGDAKPAPTGKPPRRRKPKASGTS